MPVTHARVRLACACILASLLSACVYAPVMQSSYAFDRHPGVSLETWWDGMGTNARLVNRGNVDKCAWTDALGSRLLRPGETWPISQGISPGAVGIANVMPWDPGCVNAQRDYRQGGAGSE